MYTAYIVKADETAEDARVAKAIVNLKLSGEDVVCLADDGYVTEIETLRAVKKIVGDSTLATIEDAMAALVAHKNSAAE